MSEEKVKVGVFGAGSLGQHHVRIYGELAGVELIGFFEPDEARASEISEKLEVPAFTEFDALADAIDAASVVVPTDLHLEVGTRLLQKGVHLLVEKPIAATSEEAHELVELAQQYGCVLQVGHIERFNPVLTSLEARLDEPKFIEAHRLAPFPPPRPGLKPRGTEVSVVLDLMIHDLEVVLHFVQSPLIDVRATGVSVLSDSEDIANARLEFANGCVANLTASRISPEPMRKIRVFYENAYVSLDFGAQEGVIHQKTATGIGRESLPIRKGDALTHELTSFTDCVRLRGAPKVSGEHASRALQLADRILQLIREGA